MLGKLIKQSETGKCLVVGTQNASMQKLLKEGEFTEKEKKYLTFKKNGSIIHNNFIYYINR